MRAHQRAQTAGLHYPNFTHCPDEEGTEMHR